MKFCDKLAMLRKQNNFSQEQFADKMKVSRQAVSKWESGATIPDMDKILQMCKILNCTLDELLDDGVINKKSESNNKINFNQYLNDFLSFITKSYNMFWSMKFKEKVKCLIELFIIFIILLISGMIIYNLIFSILLNKLLSIPFISKIISYVIDPLLIIFLILCGIIIFLHIFKIRYLDYFITIEDSGVDKKNLEKELDEEKIINNKKYIVEKPKEKIIIRDPKHSTLSFFKLLSNIIIIIIKFFCLLFLIPVLMVTVSVIGLGAISVSFIKYGILFFFITISLLGVCLICYLVIYFIYNFIFNKKINLKSTFIIFIISLVLIGAGSGLSVIKFMDYDRETSTSEIVKVKEEVIPMSDNLVIQDYNNNINYTIDDNVSDVKIKITSLKNAKYSRYISDSDGYKIYHVNYKEMSIFDTYDIIKKDLKNHKIGNYPFNIKLEVITSKENYNKLKANYNHYNYVDD